MEEYKKLPIQIKGNSLYLKNCDEETTELVIETLRILFSGECYSVADKMLMSGDVNG
jgi:hypothetical protein